MRPYPLLFEPLLKPRIWGGRALERLGKSLPGTGPIGESWELADLPLTIPEGRSQIANGPLAGRSLRETLDAHEAMIMGCSPRSAEGGFPLLIKYLDARENLSLQVHPTRDYARRHPEAHLKSEAWYVIHADPGSVIYRGLRPGVSRELFERHLREGTIAEDLDAVPAHTGECHYIPSGTCHALGGGVLVAEVQTPSDTTFRVFDWGREGRTLHLEQALQCIQFDQRRAPEPPALPSPYVHGAIVSQECVKTDHFAIERIEVGAGETLPVVTNGRPEVWMLLHGKARIEMSSGPAMTDAPLVVPHGATTLWPAALSDARASFEDPATILRITLPSPLQDLIA